MQGPARLLIGAGVILIIAGLAWLGIGKLPGLGRLPGDILIQRERFTFYLPLTTCLVLSLLLSLILWLISRFR